MPRYLRRIKFTNLLAATLLNVFLLATTACKDDLAWDLSGMRPVSDGWLFSDLGLPENYDYMELRRSDGWPGNSFYVVTDSAGVKCDDDVSDCNTRFDTLKSYRRSFHPGCLPGYCDFYLVTRQGDNIQTWVGLEELAEWLGPIDEPGDALLWVFANGYGFREGDAKTSGIKRLNESTFYVIATRMVRDCMPVQTDKFLLEVHRSGRIKILSQAMLHQSQGCI